MSKSARIESNDPDQPQLEVTVRGEVWRFATIEPKRVVFSGLGTAPLRQAVTIVPEERFAFKILKVEAIAGERFIDYRLETITHNGKPAYRLVVENRREQAGRYAATLSMTTDSPIKPQLYVSVYGNIQAPQAAATPRAQAASTGAGR